MTVAALFVRADSHYKKMRGVDAWDADRDARKWPGGCAVVAHPPCRAWGRLRKMAKPRPDEKQLAMWAVCQVQKYGGVLEHPEGSSLWRAAMLPRPGDAVDEFGGFSLVVDQIDFGHLARKRTWLYVVGLDRSRVPAWNGWLLPATHVITNVHGVRKKDPGFRSELGKADRERTPPLFADWLVELARRCKA